ncbi:MAG: outer membrane lipoprotein carrier protein LolA [Planctomycetes bacterium]|nr:outer membrane lipoprotein carrier protein LolA [Planctomycetota bacterium]
MDCSSDCRSASLLALAAALLLAALPAREATVQQGETPPPAPRQDQSGQQGATAPSEPWTAKAKAPRDLPGERPKDVTALFAAFAGLKGLSATYTEEKHLALLAVPLKQKGELHFLPPGTLTRVVQSPERSQLTLTDKELRMADKGGTEVIDLRKSDRVRLFVTSLLQVFRGDQEALAAHYRVTYTPSPDPAQPRAWTLELAPTTGSLQQILEKLVLSGEGVAVSRIELHEPGGDRTVTKIVLVDPARRFDDAERRSLFGDAAGTDADPAQKESARQDPAAKESARKGAADK